MELKEKLIIERHENHRPVFKVNLDFTLSETSLFRELFDKLEIADEETKFIFNINTPGGNYDTTIQIIDYIKKTKAKTIAKIYNANSAGSLIALSCKQVDVRPYSTMYIHNMQWSVPYGDINKGSWRMDYATKLVEKIYKEIYKGFLTEEEINKVVYEGYEMWLIEDEIRERLKNRGVKNGDKSNKNSD